MLVVLTLAATVLSACTPEPEPTPTPTALFASEEEAFAAAEETYRAYWKASAEVDAKDPRTFEPVFAFTTGSVNKADREALSTMHAEGYEVAGETKVIDFVGRSAPAPYEQITAEVCLDVADVTVVDADGNSRVSSERQDRFALQVQFAVKNDRVLLSSSTRPDDPSCSL